ncbi:MAG: SigB/SigF/SigG family RNA polymerase sigma factor [Chloroflexota bacterium]
MATERVPGGIAHLGGAGPSNEDLAVLARSGDARARARLIERNVGLVRSIVSRYAARGEDPDDLYQVGCIGLIKAAERFDPGFGTKFTTYAVPLIIGEIKRYLRDTGPIKVSRRLKEVAGLAQRAEARLSLELGRAPTVGEVAAALELPAEEVVEALASAKAPASLFEPVFEDDGEPILLMDQVAGGGDDNWFAGVGVRKALAELPDRDRKILYMRFFQEKTQTEVAEIMGVSQVQISRLEKHALLKMRERLGEG